MKTVYSVCGMCGTRCPVAVGVENGEAVWIQGNPHSATGSTLCPRGIAALALENDSERPQSPLMRVGARGGHKWRAVRWEEALDAVAGKLRAIRDQYGPESVMFSHRGGPFTDLYKAFARGLGTPNIYSHSVTCTRNVDQACASVLGLDRGRLVIDYRESKHIVLQSRNALEALNLAEVAGITAARANGCKVTVMPAFATAEEVAALDPDGIMLSNGPGDPAEPVEVIENLKHIFELNIPTFGICLGHQLSALAAGAKTMKLKYGHRGANQPVTDFESGRTFITSQNHGYAVVGDELPAEMGEVAQVNANDGTCEGIKYKKWNCFTVQFHPEANGGPKDTEFLFDRFLNNVKAAKKEAR